MSNKKHILDSHLNCFPRICVQSVMNMRGLKCYPGKWGPSILADFSCRLNKDLPQAKFSRSKGTRLSKSSLLSNGQYFLTSYGQNKHLF